jgi:hypothetical protein
MLRASSSPLFSLSMTARTLSAYLVLAQIEHRIERAHLDLEADDGPNHFLIERVREVAEDGG